MAAPITHLFLADKFWDKHWEIDWFQFFAWNCLPDIRYIDITIERTKFHMKNLTIDDILAEKSDFLKGVKFHSFVDERRDNFYEEHNIYIPKVSDENFIKALKFLEDDVLYWKLSFRQDFINFFNEYEFPIYDINWESIKKWKSMLSDYFREQPCSESRHDFILWIWLNEDTYNQIESKLEEIRKNNLQNINDMILFLENLIE